jgi:hypothetical protein
MSTTPQKLLTYGELIKRQRVHVLRVSEVPTDHAVSLGLPTRRWLGAGYAFFASPALRRPADPIEQHPPDRWWVLDAHTGHLLVYALSGVLPFADGQKWDMVRLPRTNLSMDQQRAAYARLSEQLDRLAPLFFKGENAAAAERKALADALAAAIPAPVLPQYRALVPDFFAWLEA